MSEFKGTKGQWLIENIESSLETEIVSGKIRVAQAKHFNDNKGIWFTNDPTHEEGKANALLISKAPEMLEMLERILQFNIEDAPEIKTEIENLIKEATQI